MSQEKDTLSIPDTDVEQIFDPYFTDFNVVKFTGGPLDGQTRRMDVYVPVIPVYSYGFYDHANNMPRAYYQNVNATAGVSDDLRQKGSVHYVFFVEGKRVDG
jgi:hypothetical protein